MADGVTAANANSALTTWTASAVFVQLHTGAPGAAGNSNVSSTTTRPAVAWNAASAGSITASNQPAWANWAGTNGEIDTDVSFWSLAAAGVFQFSAALSAPVTMGTGDTLTLTSITVSIPVAS